jgi:hypothetical protein
MFGNIVGAWRGGGEWSDELEVGVVRSVAWDGVGGVCRWYLVVIHRCLPSVPSWWVFTSEEKIYPVAGLVGRIPSRRVSAGSRARFSRAIVLRAGDGQ